MATTDYLGGTIVLLHSQRSLVRVLDEYPAWLVLERRYPYRQDLPRVRRRYDAVCRSMFACLASVKHSPRSKGYLAKQGITTGITIIVCCSVQCGDKAAIHMTATALALSFLRRRPRPQRRSFHPEYHHALIACN